MTILEEILSELREIKQQQKEIKEAIEEISNAKVILEKDLYYETKIINQKEWQESEVIKVLDKIRIPKDRPGYHFLKKAILISLEVEKTDMQYIYIRIKEEDNIETNIVETEIQKVIIPVINNRSKAMYEIFGTYYIIGSVKGFISGLAEYVKMQKK